MTAPNQRITLFGVAGVAQRSIDEFLEVLERAAADGRISPSEFPALESWGDKVCSDVRRILDAVRPRSTAIESEDGAGEGGRS